MNCKLYSASESFLEEDHLNQMKERFTEFVLDGQAFAKAHSSNEYAAKENRYDRPIFTLGIEEEFQIIDPETRELCSQSQRNYGPV